MKKIKKAVVLLLAAIMAFSVGVLWRPLDVSATFTDVEDNYATHAINRWAGYGVIVGRGDGTFDPTGFITRAEFATMLYRIMGYTNIDVVSFDDVQETAWFYDAVMSATTAGVFNAGGAFRPNEYITRGEAADAFVRSLGLNVTTDVSRTIFIDDPTFTPELRGVIEAASNAGIIHGTPVNGAFEFVPSGNIMRRHAALMFDNAIAYFINTDGNHQISAVNRGFIIINAQDVNIVGRGTNQSIIIAEGVGEGSVNLENITLSGNLIVRGGGADLVRVDGDSTIPRLYVGDNGSVVIGEDVAVEVLNLGHDTVVCIHGTVDEFNVIGNDSFVTIHDTASVDEKNVLGDNLTLIIAPGGTIETLNVEGEGLDKTGVIYDVSEPEEDVAPAPTPAPAPALPPAGGGFFPGPPAAPPAPPALVWTNVTSEFFGVPTYHQTHGVTFIIIEPLAGVTVPTNGRFLVNGAVTQLYQHTIDGIPQFRVAIDGTPATVTVVFQVQR